jgi:L-histidine Nalpha-methyltransferase
MRERANLARPLSSAVPVEPMWPALSAAASPEELQEVLAGLGSSPRRLPCKLLYDARGSELFERITELPEYYCTRVELSILREHAHQMARHIGPEALLVELGSGSSRKTRLLLDQLLRPRAYVPIDISPSALDASVRSLRLRYPELEVRPLVADYTHSFALPLTEAEASAAAGKLVYFFPGSTIGNFEPDAAVDFLRRLRGLCSGPQQWLIGVDTPKDRSVLEPAYDDAQGVTAAFNLNLLQVVNRRCAASFLGQGFRHRALWRPREGRVEMQLVSRYRQTVRIAQQTLQLEAGEIIVTEHCYKYEPEAFGLLVAQAGFAVERVWLDAQRRFSVHLLQSV